MVTNTWSTPTYVLFLPFLLGTLWLTEGDYRSTFGFLGGVVGARGPADRADRRRCVRAVPAVLEPLRAAGAQLRLGARHAGAAAGLPDIFGLFLFVLVPFLYALWVRSMRRDGEPLGRRARPVARPGRRRSSLASLGRLDARLLRHPVPARPCSSLLAPQHREPLAHPAGDGDLRLRRHRRLRSRLRVGSHEHDLQVLPRSVVDAGARRGGRRAARCGAAACRCRACRRVAPRCGSSGWSAWSASGCSPPAPTSWGVIHTNRVQTPKPTLDGMAYLRLQGAGRAGRLRVAEQQHRGHSGHPRSARRRATRSSPASR